MTSPTGKPPGSRSFPKTSSTHPPSASPSNNGRISPAEGIRYTPTPSVHTEGQSETILLGNRSTNPYTSEATLHETAETVQLKSRFGKQWNTVQAMRAQNHMLDHLDQILHSLNNPSSSTNTRPFTIIHIDETGVMNRLVPEDKKAFQQDAAKAEQARNQLIDSFRKIDSAYTREQTHEFKIELSNAEATLTGIGAQLQGVGITTPPVPKGFVSTSITDFLRTRVTEATKKPLTDTPANHSSAEAPLSGVFRYQPEPVHEPEPEEPDFRVPVRPNPPPPPPPPPPPVVKTETKEPPPKPPQAGEYDNPDVSPESLEGQPSYLAAINKLRVFKDSAQKARPTVEVAPLALLVGDPQNKATDARLGNSHITRKALLFELLIKQHQISGHDEAIHFSDNIIRLIQLGIMSTDVSEQNLFDGQPDPKAEAECEKFLSQGESVTPRVAAFVAGIVAGTKHQDSIAAKVMRDVIRLEDMRFLDNFDIDCLESNRDYRVPDAQKKVATRFCDQWRRLLALEGELTNAARLQNRATDIHPTEADYKPQDDPDRRAGFDNSDNPYAMHLKLLNDDERLRFLKHLIHH